MSKFFKGLKLRKDEEISLHSQDTPSGGSNRSTTEHGTNTFTRSPPQLTRSPIIRRNYPQNDMSTITLGGGRDDGQPSHEDTGDRSISGRGRDEGQRRYIEQENRLIGGSERSYALPTSLQACPLPSPVSVRRINLPYDEKDGFRKSFTQSVGSGHGFLLPSLPTSLQQSSGVQTDQSDGSVDEVRHGISLDIPAKVPFVNGREDDGDIRSRRHSHDVRPTYEYRSASNSRLQSPEPSPRHNTSRNEHFYSEFRPDFQSSSESPHNGGSTSSMVAAAYPLPQPPLSPRISLSNTVSAPAISAWNPRPAINVSLNPPLSPRISVSNTVTAPPAPSPRSPLTSNVSLTPLSPRKINLSVTPPLSPRGTIPQSPRKVDLDVTCGKWVKGSLIGSGAFGRVYKGIHSKTGEFCAIKEVEFVRDDPKSKDSAKQLAQEIAFLSSFSHPNIVQYKGSELVGDSLYIYLELISGGSLYKLLSEFKKLEEPVIKRYTRQILLGLQFLHSRHTVHRDIKCANILVDQDGTVKLADFGLAKYIKEQGIPFSMKGSPLWMAPEVIMQRNTGYEYAVDIWSLGCTVIEMATGKPPWCEFEPVVVMFKVTRGELPPAPEGLSPEGQSFVELCLEKDPANRPSALELLEHPFLQIENNHVENVVHAFAALEALDIEIEPIPSLSGKQPSLSAPSSPRSSNEVFSTLYPTRSTGFLTPPRGIPGGSSLLDGFDDREDSRRPRKSKTTSMQKR